MQLLKQLVPSLLRKYSRASVKAFFGTKISEKPHLLRGHPEPRGPETPAIYQIEALDKLQIMLPSNVQNCFKKSQKL